VNKNVIFILCIVVGITALLLVGKKASKTPNPANATVARDNQGAPAPSSGDPAKGTLAPAFELKSIPDGKAVPLSSLRGKAVMLNFWATWCGPCKLEMPWLVDLQKKYGPDGLQIVGVAMDDTDQKDIDAFAKKMGVNYIVLQGTEKVGDAYGGVSGLPESFFLDRSGKIVDETVGLVSQSEIENNIKKSLQKGS
jgi:thiol-disulfide isomerase/thioredoxin